MKIIGQKLFPCIFEDDFFNSDLTDKVLDDIDQKLKKLDNKIKVRIEKNLGTGDLDKEKVRLRTLLTELPNIIGELEEISCINFKEDTKKATEKLLKDLQKNNN